MELPQIEDFRRLFIEDIPLLDVRAPVEFHKGSLPLAENHPLINDEERHEIGIRYKELGQDAAIDLGHELVEGETKRARVGEWENFARQHPQGVLFCWRGGMRSKISQQWLYEQSGILYPRIKGGYKALRRFLIDEMERSTASVSMYLVGGRTGVGKTHFLNTLSNSIDLEGLANHRGSAFGPRARPQPNQTDFENALSIALIKHIARGNPPLLLEDEGRNIGARAIPEPFFNKMKASPLLLLEVSLEERVNITHQEYIHDALAEYQALYGEEAGFARWSEYLLGSLDKIKKRLGGVRHKELRAVMESDLARQATSGETNQHRGWIRTLLADYYDPMYDYQIEKNRERIVFRGNGNEVRAYIASL